MNDQYCASTGIFKNDEGYTQLCIGGTCINDLPQGLVIVWCRDDQQVRATIRHVSEALYEAGSDFRTKGHNIIEYRDRSRSGGHQRCWTMRFMARTHNNWEYVRGLKASEIDYT